MVLPISLSASLKCVLLVAILVKVLYYYAGALFIVNFSTGVMSLELSKRLHAIKDNTALNCVALFQNECNSTFLMLFLETIGMFCKRIVPFFDIAST